MAEQIAELFGNYETAETETKLNTAKDIYTDK